MHEVCDTLLEQVESAILGQNDLITETLCAFLASGHILLTGAPGLAKTTLVRVFATSLGLKFGRIQFTPDLLPSDIMGTEILNIDPITSRRSFEFSKGPIFVNLLLADEINRASPRTQSAMLEAMQEKSVTCGGKSYELSRPFMVFATQNPYESEGTFALPEAQLDRFLLHTIVDYPDSNSEFLILKKHAQNELTGEIHQDKWAKNKAISHEDVLSLQAKVKEVNISDESISVINQLVRMSRPDDPNCPEDLKNMIRYGAGPRAGISLISLCKALAFLEKKPEVRFSHIERLAKPALRHRIRLSAQAYRDRISCDSFIEMLLSRIRDKYSKKVLG